MRLLAEFPLFLHSIHFIVKSRVIEEKKGVNPQQLEQKIIQHKVNKEKCEGSAGVAYLKTFQIFYRKSRKMQRRFYLV
jgi:hypothetical protein